MQKSERSALRVIEGTVASAPAISLSDAVEHRAIENELRSYARDFEARNGRNAYSDYILKYGRLPDPQHAAVLGRLINRKVRASDRTLQPRLIGADRARNKTLRTADKRRRARAVEIQAFLCAICDLAAITEYYDLVENLGPTFGHPLVRENLDSAIESLLRIAREWHRHEQEVHD